MPGGTRDPVSSSLAWRRIACNLTKSLPLRRHGASVQAQEECCPTAIAATNACLSSMGPGHDVNQVETEAVALMRGLAGVKALAKDCSPEFLWDTWAAIFDAQLCVLPTVTKRHVHRRPCGGVSNGVPDQVFCSTQDQVWVNVDGRSAVNRETDAATSSCPGERRCCPLDQMAKIGELKLQGVSRVCRDQSEDIGRHRIDAPGSGESIGNVLAGRLTQSFVFLKELKRRKDACERVTEVVNHHRHQLITKREALDQLIALLPNQDVLRSRPEKVAHTEAKLSGMERLGEKIVRASTESFNPCVSVVKRSEHEDGQMRGSLRPRSNHVDAINAANAGHHDVEQHKVDAVFDEWASSQQTICLDNVM